MAGESDPVAEQIDAAIAARASGGFVESFQNGQHRADLTPLAELEDVLERRDRRQAARSGGFSLAQYDPNL